MTAPRPHFTGVLLFSGLVIALAVSGVVWFYLHSSAILRADIHDHLKTYAALAAMDFTAEELQRIRDKSDMETPLFSNLVTRAERIQQTLPNVTYVYAMRKTDDPMQLEFIIENGMLWTFEQNDENGDGIIQPDEEPTYPGERFDITDMPAMQVDAWQGPAVDPEVTHDQWGSWMTGYAPILDEEGNAVAIIGIDMDAAQYVHATRRIFSPIALLIVLLCTLLIMGAFSYGQWKNRIKILESIDQSRRDIVTIASHKLGGPIATMRWWLDMIKEPEIKDSKTAQKELEGAIERLSQIMNDLEIATKTEMTGEDLRQKLADETQQELN